VIRSFLLVILLEILDLKINMRGFIGDNSYNLLEALNNATCN
jgi:hypothetical protein